jgi:putative membrane protein
MKHPVRAEKFFTGEERDRIRETAVKVEARTVGEIAVAVVDQSSQYHEAEMLGGIFLASMVSLVLTGIFFHASVWSFIPLAFLCFFPSCLLFRRVPVLKRVFVSRGRRDRAVKERALRTFYEKGLYKTQGATGVLFFLSLLERKVWVLADRGIHGKIHQPTLNKFASLVSRGIQEGRAADALCESIEGIGALLAVHYPATGPHADQLTDEIICGPGAACETDGE